MDRILEPVLMTNEDQCREFALASRAYARVAFVQWIFEKILVKGKIADLGCGPGDFLIDICNHDNTLDIVGFDGSAAMVSQAKSLIEKNKLEERITIKNLLFENITENNFDVSISSLSLHHQSDPLTFWNIVKRITKNDGYVFIMDLIRPESEASADNIVQIYAASDHQLFQQDYKNSLLSSFTIPEIQHQLIMSDLSHLTIENMGQVVLIYGKISK